MGKGCVLFAMFTAAVCQPSFSSQWIKPTSSTFGTVTVVSFRAFFYFFGFFSFLCVCVCVFFSTFLLLSFSCYCLSFLLFFFSFSFSFWVCVSISPLFSFLFSLVYVLFFFFWCVCEIERGCVFFSVAFASASSVAAVSWSPIAKSAVSSLNRVHVFLVINHVLSRPFDYLQFVVPAGVSQPK